jgi:azurin
MQQYGNLFNRGHKMFRAVTIIFFLSLLSMSSAASANECAITLQTDDALRFLPSHIVVPKRCKDFTVTLTHTGHLPALAMSHNWVLTKKSDLDGVARTGMAAGPAEHHVDQSDKRVIAHTKLIGTGETASVTFSVSQLTAGETYMFLCTFAGHSPIMRGTLVVE